jgi:hypothetical protein
LILFIFFCHFLIGLFFYLFSMGLSQSQDPSRGFGNLTQIDLVYFFKFFFNWFFFQFHSFTIQQLNLFFLFSFFQFHPLILGCLGIKLRIFFLICFMWNHPDLMDLVFFSRLQASTLDLLEMEFCKFFYSLFIRLSWFHGLGHRFNRLARVDLYCFFLCFF